jgi:CBS domain-containing protein
MMTIQHILERKGRSVWTVEPETTVFEAIKLMDEKNIGALIVLRHGSIAGIMSERDYMRKVIIRGGSSKEMRVEEIMTPEVVTIAPALSLEECMKLMTNNHIRHLPVVEKDALVGMISIGDVVKEIISEQDHTISQLKNYITGAR